jgi:FG-GAP-like repeat
VVKAISVSRNAFSNLDGLAGFVVFAALGVSCLPDAAMAQLTFNNVIRNSGFETGSLSPWVITSANPAPVVTTVQHHSGTRSALLGTVSGSEPFGNSSFYQQITVPAAGGTLSYWWRGGTRDSLPRDYQDVYVTNTSGFILATIQHTCANTGGWLHKTFNMTPYAGQTVRIKFLVHQNGAGDDTWLYVDDIILNSPNANYVLYNASTRATAVWRLNNNVFTSNAGGPTLPAGWRLVDAADFDGNGRPDYSLFNASTGQSAIWYLSGTTFVNSAVGPTIPSGWVLMTTADFNRDGHPDYVLYNASTGQTAIWYMNNNVFVNAAYGPALPVDWRLVDAADFNGDGRPDYLLFRPSTGDTAIWYLSGTIFVNSVIGPIIPSGWVLVTTADFNMDGHPDYVLYEPATRKTAIWYLNNSRFVGSAYGPTFPAGWSLVDALPSVP